MPLKVPNYRAVSELFRKKVAAEPSTIFQKARDRIGRIRKNPLPKPSGPSTLFQKARDRIGRIRKNPLPKPSGPLDMSDQTLYPSSAFAVPIPTQPPPRKGSQGLRTPSIQGSTIPLSGPIADPRLDHLIGDSVTRRDAISTALGEPRATNFIDKSAAYRQANPEIFKGVYDGGNIDLPIKVLRNDAFFAPSGLYSPTRYVPETNEIVPGKISVRGDSPFGTLMHELFHLDTSGSSPQDVEGIIKDAQKGEVSPIVQMRYNRNLPPDSRTGKDAKVITDLAYHPERKGSNRSEIGSQLGALRVHLEQQGIDTSNKEELRKALSTMGDDPRIMHNFEAQRIYRALNDPTLSPQQRERGLDALVELMPGIAKADTNQYPYRKVASDLFSKKDLSLPSGVPNRPYPPIGVPRRPAQPSGVPDRPAQKRIIPTEYVVPTPTQPPPQSFAPQLRKPPMQRSTMPMSAPLYDHRLDHLTDGEVTRRQAISTALGEPRATNFIDKSTEYRQANPKIFKGVYDGGNIDRPIKVNRNNSFLAPHGVYASLTFDPKTNGVLPGQIYVRSDNPFATLMHELFHLDTSGSRPQDIEEPLKVVQKTPAVKPFRQTLFKYNRLLPVGSRTGKDAKVITDRSYDPDGKYSGRSEMGSQLGALRIHLEQQGIDTSNKETLREALRTMGDNPRIMHNAEAQRIHRALNDPTLSPEQRERGLDALVELMPGIAKADTNQYPYRKVASESSSSLRGLAIMSTISSLLKNR